MEKAKIAQADWENIKRIFTLPESENSSLGLLEKEISQNINGFLSQHIVTDESEPEELEYFFSDTAIPEDPIFVSEEAHFLLSKVVAHSVHVSSPKYIGHMTSAVPYFMLPLAKIMFALNQNLVKIETSKAFTPLERKVLGILHRLVYNCNDEFYSGYTHHRTRSIGAFCSGGTIANITALWVARNKLLSPIQGFSGINEEGIAAGLKAHGYDGLAVMVSKRGHYSLTKAADLLGIGKKNVVLLETDSKHKLDVSYLKNKIAELQKARIGIIAVVGIAGTTETGSVDPLTDVADLCKTNNIWFHVDAAWGGPTLFSKTYRPVLSGIEKADSVSMDSHKQLYTPVGAGIVLFKNPDSLSGIEQKANYIIREGSRDIGKHTLEGSRSGMAMLVHSALRIIGRKGYELLIDTGIEKARYFAELISKQSDFELISAPELNILTYRFVPRVLREKLHEIDESSSFRANEIINALTTVVQKKQRAKGKSFVSRTTLEVDSYQNQQINVFRVVLSNPLTSKENLVEVLCEQREIGKAIVDEYFSYIEDFSTTNFADFSKYIKVDDVQSNY